MEARRDGVFFRVVHSVSDIENLRIDDTSMLYHRSYYKTYTSRRNCGFFKAESIKNQTYRRLSLGNSHYLSGRGAGKF
jgi:hypothetical protein